MDSAIQQINRYPVDSAIGFPNTYPLDSDLCSGWHYPAFEQLGPDIIHIVVVPLCGIFAVRLCLNSSSPISSLHKL